MSRHDGLPDVLRPAEVARVLRVHVGTLRRWDKEGKLGPCTRSVGGQRRYARADVLALLGEEDAGGEKTAAVYARVSTAKQAEAGKLERQRLLPLTASCPGSEGAWVSSPVPAANARAVGSRQIFKRS